MERMSRERLNQISNQIQTPDNHDDKSLYSYIVSATEQINVWIRQSPVIIFEKVMDTHGRVYSHRLSYYRIIIVRKGGDYFYGK